MYEPPVDIYLINRGLAEKIAADRDDVIMSEITEQLGVNVEKYELERALAFDRGQYNKGFDDGVKEGIQKLLNAVNPNAGDVWLCNSCKYDSTNAMNYPCSCCRYVTCSEMSKYKWEPKED